MKQRALLLAAIATLALSACSQSQRPAANQKENPQNVTNKKGKNMNVQELSTTVFKQKVMNYEQHPQEWVFEGDKPAVIDFYATWCGPCKATAPIVEALAEQYAGKVDFYKVDVDKESELAGLFGIRSIPSLLFIPKDGKPQMQVGAMNRQQMEQAMQSTLFK